MLTARPAARALCRPPGGPCLGSASGPQESRARTGPDLPLSGHSWPQRGRGRELTACVWPGDQVVIPNPLTAGGASPLRPGRGSWPEVSAEPGTGHSSTATGFLPKLSPHPRRGCFHFAQSGRRRWLLRGQLWFGLGPGEGWGEHCGPADWPWVWAGQLGDRAGQLGTGPASWGQGRGSGAAGCGGRAPGVGQRGASQDLAASQRRALAPCPMGPLKPRVRPLWPRGAVSGHAASSRPAAWTWRREVPHRP